VGPTSGLDTMKKRKYLSGIKTGFNVQKLLFMITDYSMRKHKSQNLMENMPFEFF
jgi:hypothetical protein